MERAILRISPENMMSVFIMSALAYAGVVGMKSAFAYYARKTGKAA